MARLRAGALEVYFSLGSLSLRIFSGSICRVMVEPGCTGREVADKKKAVGAFHLVVGVGYGDAAAVGVFVEAAGKLAHIPFGRFGALVHYVFKLVIIGVEAIVGHTGTCFSMVTTFSVRRILITSPSKRMGL